MQIVNIPTAKPFNHLANKRAYQLNGPLPQRADADWIVYLFTILGKAISFEHILKVSKSLHKHYNLQVPSLQQISKHLDLLSSVSFWGDHTLKVSLKWEHVFKLENEAAHEVLKPFGDKLNISNQEVEERRSTFQIDMNKDIFEGEAI